MKSDLGPDEPLRWDGYETAKVIRVIMLQFKRGSGVNPDPVRVVTQYRTLDGELLSEVDPYATA